MLGRVTCCGKPASSNVSTRSDQGLGIPTKTAANACRQPRCLDGAFTLTRRQKTKSAGWVWGWVWGWTWGNVGALEIVESPEKSGPRATSVFHPGTPSRQRAARDHGLRIIAHVSARVSTTQKRSVRSNPTSTQF